MKDQCSGFTKEGHQCSRSVERPFSFCWLHDPSREEDRRRAASKAGRAKPHNRELTDIKAKLLELADSVLEGATDKGAAAVAGQLYNYALRVVTVELKVQEAQDFEVRLDEIEKFYEEHTQRRSRDGW